MSADARPSKAVGSTAAGDNAGVEPAARRPIALFDLDHTLIPFDSGMAFIRFLVARGRLPPEAEAMYLGYAHQYLAGTLDIRAMHRAILAPLIRHPRAVLQGWAEECVAELAPRVPASMKALVASHLEAGHRTAIVTATTRLIAAPYGSLFGVETVLATETQLVGEHYSGEIEGEPCYREFKLDHVARWLAASGLALADGARSWFYSDSAGDLPLLEAVSDPVAVTPDERLRAVAVKRGWDVVDAR